MSKIEPKIIQEPLKKSSFNMLNNELGGDSSSDFGSLFGISNLSTPVSIENEIGKYPVNSSSQSPEIVGDMISREKNIQSNLLENVELISAEMGDEFDNSEIGFFNVIPQTEKPIGENVLINKSESGKFSGQSVPGLAKLNARQLLSDTMQQNPQEKIVASADQTGEIKNDWLGFERKRTIFGTGERLFGVKDTAKPEFTESENGKNPDPARTKMAVDLIDRSQLMHLESNSKAVQNQYNIESQVLKNAMESIAPSNLQKGTLLDHPMAKTEVRKIFSSSALSDLGASLLSNEADQGSAHQGGSNSSTTGGNLAKASQTQMLDMMEILDTAQENWSEVLLNRIKNGIRGKKDFIELQLSPKNLGKLRIALMVQNDQASIRVQTENSMAAAMVAESNQKLVQMFEAAGFRLTDFNSSLGGQAGSQAFNQNNHRNTDDAANAKSIDEESVNPDGLADRSDVSKISENLINIEA